VKDYWSAYIKDLFRILKPGTGWAQVGEFGLPTWVDDGSVPADGYYARVLSLTSD
jgi:hypothetical protein